ncbi:Aldo/keto reductase [Cristinia sonorae]|uniref:Aldo/keto reductase n=1 Tax=Cristinia sonorae TaxID=1940300 RepID=A0A8K0UT28_9AGAR|nr:Aldo/keto reductase [Cristinia sonorae]
MPWDVIKLNDGNVIPNIAFGTWTLGNGQTATDNVDQAISIGFTHVDTAQSYRNEAEAGVAIHESGLAREDIYITTKYSGLNGLDVETSIQNSLQNLGVKYVDLYLVHSPRLAVPDIPTIWAKMEKIKEAGYAKSIGVSNFEIDHLQTLLASAKIKPAANQILLHPYVIGRQAPLVRFCQENDIVVEAYSVLIPLTRRPGGPVEGPVNDISTRLDVKPEQVLLAWAKAKGAVVVTSSTKKERLEGYLTAGDIELTPEDINNIDNAGAAGARRMTARTVLKRVVTVVLIGAAVFGACGYLGIDVL